MQGKDRVGDISEIKDGLLQAEMYEVLRCENIEDIPDDDSLEDFFTRAETEVSWADGGEVVASCILAAAKLIESRLANSAASVSSKLDSRREKEIEKILQKAKMLSPEKKHEINGKKDIVYNSNKEIIFKGKKDIILTLHDVQKLKEKIKEKREKLKEKTEKLKEKTEVVALKTIDGARQASLKMKENTEKITFGIRGTASEAVIMLSERADEVDFAGKLCPNPEGKEAFNAAGNVATAGFGAAALIFEALYATTRTVASKSCEVTADVTRHKYGESAGKFVENTGHTVGNALRTVHLLSQLNGASFAKAVARDTGKKKMLKKSAGLERQSSGISSAGSAVTHGASLSKCNSTVATELKSTSSRNSSEFSEDKIKLAGGKSLTSSCSDNSATGAKTSCSKMKSKHLRSSSDNYSCSSERDIRTACSKSYSEASNRKMNSSSTKSTSSRNSSRVSKGESCASAANNFSSNSRSPTVYEKTRTYKRNNSDVSEDKSIRTRSYSYSKSHSFSSHDVRKTKLTDGRNSGEVKSNRNQIKLHDLECEEKKLKSIEHEPLLSKRDGSCPPLDDTLQERGRSATLSVVEPFPSHLHGNTISRARSSTMSTVCSLPSPQRFAA